MSIHPTNRSEVARLREQITKEHEAACFALTGLSQNTSKHWFITRRMQAIGGYQEELAALVGEQQSIEIVAAVMESSPKQKEVDDGEKRSQPCASKDSNITASH